MQTPTEIPITAGFYGLSLYHVIQVKTPTSRQRQISAGISEDAVTLKKCGLTKLNVNLQNEAGNIIFEYGPAHLEQNRLYVVSYIALMTL